MGKEWVKEWWWELRERLNKDKLSDHKFWKVNKEECVIR